MAQTFEFNKSNWSGERATLTVEDDGTFSVYDYKFRLEISEDPHNDGGKYDATVAKVVSVDGSWKFPLASGVKFACDKYWTMMTDGGCMSREDENPYIAAAQVLYNII